MSDGVGMHNNGILQWWKQVLGGVKTAKSYINELQHNLKKSTQKLGLQDIFIFQ